jgi:hypothetical protein
MSARVRPDNKEAAMSDKLKIMTNNQPRDILTWHDLSEKERAGFDYLDSEEKQDGASFVRYRKWVYDLGEFMRCSDHWPVCWHGYSSDSFFSGTLIRYVDDNERVIMGWYCS